MPQKQTNIRGVATRRCSRFVHEGLFFRNKTIILHYFLLVRTFGSWNKELWKTKDEDEFQEAPLINIWSSWGSTDTVSRCYWKRLQGGKIFSFSYVIPKMLQEGTENAGAIHLKKSLSINKLFIALYYHRERQMNWKRGRLVFLKSVVNIRLQRGTQSWPCVVVTSFFTHATTINVFYKSSNFSDNSKWSFRNTFLPRLTTGNNKETEWKLWFNMTFRSIIWEIHFNVFELFMRLLPPLSEGGVSTSFNWPPDMYECRLSITLPE